LTPDSVYEETTQLPGLGEMMVGNVTVRGPNVYGWLGIILFTALSVWELSWWPIICFIGINFVIGLVALIVRRNI
jgi:hypothetical protein